MGQSVLVFVSHSSEDKESLVLPIVADLEECYINVWLDKQKIVPGDNLRKSIFRDGLDKADIVLIFFTTKSLHSSWVDQEIKHVLREENKKTSQFDLRKIISIFDTKETYNEIAERYPELTDDLLHLMPSDYTKIQLGQLITAIWSKYFSLQGGDIETQKQLLAKDKEIFQKDKKILDLENQVASLINNSANLKVVEEFKQFVSSKKIDKFLLSKDIFLRNSSISGGNEFDLSAAVAFGLLELSSRNYASLTDKGKDFFKWYIINNEQ